MVNLLLIIVLTSVLMFSIVLMKTYHQVSAKELKRQARSGDELADALYRVVAYDGSLTIFLWIFSGLSASLLFVLLVNMMPTFLATFCIAGLIWFSFAWLPSSHGTRFGNTLAKYTAKPLSYVLDFLYPVLSRIDNFFGKHRPVNLHTGLYTRQDLLGLLENQKGQLDNRISKDELIIAKNALEFGDALVRDVMTPRRVMKEVSADEAIGPILLVELHKSGHSRFPVYEGKKDNLVGVLLLRDAVNAKNGGRVKTIMMKKTYYVHDESSLDQVLDAFIKTHHHMFFVVNNFEEIVGLITMEDVLERILGKKIIDEFDRYDDLRSVAAKNAKIEHDQNNEVATVIDRTDSGRQK